MGFVLVVKGISFILGKWLRLVASSVIFKIILLLGMLSAPFVSGTVPTDRILKWKAHNLQQCRLACSATDSLCLEWQILVLPGKMLNVHVFCKKSQAAGLNLTLLYDSREQQRGWKKSSCPLWARQCYLAPLGEGEQLVTHLWRHPLQNNKGGTKLSALQIHTVAPHCLPVWDLQASKLDKLGLWTRFPDSVCFINLHHATLKCFLLSCLQEAQ